MSSSDELLRNNERYVETFAAAGIPSPPAKRVAVLACMDARLLPERILGLEEGDAHVIRNAGGIVTEDAVRSLALSQHLLGTEEIILIHHTDCGMTSSTDEEIVDRLYEEAGQLPPWRPGAIADIEQSLRDSIARIRADPFIPHTEKVRGFVYEVETGRLREIE